MPARARSVLWQAARCLLFCRFAGAEDSLPCALPRCSTARARTLEPLKPAVAHLGPCANSQGRESWTPRGLLLTRFLGSVSPFVTLL